MSKVHKVLDLELSDEVKKLNGKSANRLKKCAKDLQEAIIENEEANGENKLC